MFWTLFNRFDSKKSKFSLLCSFFGSFLREVKIYEIADKCLFSSIRKLRNVKFCTFFANDLKSGFFWHPGLDSTWKTGFVITKTRKKITLEIHYFYTSFLTTSHFQGHKSPKFAKDAIKNCSDRLIWLKIQVPRSKKYCRDMYLKSLKF